MSFRRVILPLLFCCVASAPGYAAKLQISHDGDARMACRGYSQEAMRMHGIIASMQNRKDDSKMQTRGIGVVGTAASYLVGTVTGGLSIAAAGFIAGQATDERGEDAEEIQDIAQQRRAVMVGMFKAKNCTGPIEFVFNDPEPNDPIRKITKIQPAAGEQGPTSYND